MKPTRREFVTSALATATLMATGNALAATLSAGSPHQEETMANSNHFEWKTVRVSDGTDMRVYTSWPENSSGKLPGVIVLQEIFGVNAYIQDVTDRIAKLGYIAVAPELFHRTAPGFEGNYTDSKSSMDQKNQMKDEGQLADLQATYDLLIHDPRVDGQSIGSVGYCMGGRTSYLANIALPLKAAVSYYGAGIAPGLLDKVKDLHGPMLFFWGGKDQHIGIEQPRQVADALRAAGKSFADVTFSEADHGFFCDVRKSYNPDAARESWALFAAFFRDHLNAAPGQNDKEGKFHAL